MKQSEILRLIAETIWKAYVKAEEDQVEAVLSGLWETFADAAAERHLRELNET